MLQQTREKKELEDGSYTSGKSEFISNNIRSLCYQEKMKTSTGKGRKKQLSLSISWYRVHIAKRQQK